MNATNLTALIVAITGLLSAIPAIILALRAHNTVNNDVKPQLESLQERAGGSAGTTPPKQPPAIHGEGT